MLVEEHPNMKCRRLWRLILIGNLVFSSFSRLPFVLRYMECLCHPYIESLPTLWYLSHSVPWSPTAVGIAQNTPSVTKMAARKSPSAAKRLQENRDKVRSRKYVQSYTYWVSLPSIKNLTKLRWYNVPLFIAPSLSSTCSLRLTQISLTKLKEVLRSWGQAKNSYKVVALEYSSISKLESTSNRKDSRRNNKLYRRRHTDSLSTGIIYVLIITIGLCKRKVPRRDRSKLLVPQ